MINRWQSAVFPDNPNLNYRNLQFQLAQMSPELVARAAATVITHLVGSPAI